MITYAEDVVSLCMQRGASECEVCIEDKLEKTVTLQRNEVATKREKHEVTMGLRVLLGKRKGFKATTLPASREDVVETAMTLAQHAEEDPDWECLPSPRKLSDVKGIYDEKIAEIEIEDLIELSGLLGSPYKDVFIDGRLVTSYTRSFIVNSHGVNHTGESTKEYIFVSCLPRKGKASAFMDWAVSRKLDIDCEKLVENSARTVLDSMKAVNIEEGFKGELLVSGNVCAQIFMTSLAAAVNAESFKRGLTPFQNRIHQKVTSENMVVHDTGILYGGVCSFPWDREGTPCQHTPLIEKGVLNTMLHNKYTAQQFKTESTGNAVGTAMIEPLVGIQNLVITPGNYATEELVENIKKGMYIKGFSGATDVTTGNFSGVAPHSYYIEKGEIQSPVRCLISGNSFSSLLNILLIGKEQKANLEGMYAVPLVMDEINIVPSA